jgi:oligopeptide transport system substrate-binding protein
MRIFLLLAAMLQFLHFSPAKQADTVLFSGDTARITFPNTIDFTTTISSNDEIADVVFLYGTDERTCSDVQAMSLPQYTPGKLVTAKWQWDMRNSGSLPPGTQVWWQWKVVTKGGHTVTSEKQTITWLDSAHPWKVAEKDSVRVHYYEISSQQADELVTTALNAIQRLEADTGMTPSGTVDLYMYATNKDLQDAVLYESGWTGGLAFTDYNKIAIGMELKDMDWTKRTEAHELTHVLVGNYTFTCLWTTPTWLEEGLAVYGEGEPDANTKDTFKKAIENNELLSFNILSASFSEDPGKADISYSQSYYMVRYLVETYGRDKINSLLKTLSGGTTVDDALKKVYGFDLAGFENEWRASLGLSVNAAATPTPLPTEIPTMKPVAIVEQDTSTATAMPAVTVQPTSLPSVMAAAADTAAPTRAGEATVTPTPASVPPMQPLSAAMIAIIILCGAGVFLIIGLIILISQFGRKKKPIISALILFVLTASLAGTTRASAADTAVEPRTDFPPFPTATLYRTPFPRTDVFTNREAGVSINIPPYVAIDTSEAAANFFFSFKLEGWISGYLKSVNRVEGKTLQDTARELRVSELKGLANFTYLVDEPVTLASGTSGWKTVTDFQFPNEPDRNYRATMISVRGYSSIFVLVFYSARDNFAQFGTKIDEFTNTLTITAPVINGFSRDDLLLLDGGETDNPAENDPATASGSAGFDLIFSGLVTYGPSMNLTPDLAKSWDVSDGGRVYTFHLQPNAVFHNGRPFTADDVVYSWERAANAATKSDTVMIYLGDIQGVKEMHEGKADHISGLKAVDAHTLQVTLAQPVPYFLLKLTYPTTYIVDRDNVSKGGKWYLTPNGTGPFRLTRWVSRDYRQYERFDAFYGDKPKIKIILVQLYKGTSLQLYENGQVDYAYVGGGNLTRFTDPSEPMSKQLKTSVNMCTGYYTLDTTQPPFDDVKVRQAFAMSVDKEKFVKVIGRGNLLPSAGLYPPALPGFDRTFTGLPFDPAKANELLKESKYGSGDFPPVTISISSYGNGVPEEVSALAQMWEENLGVKITVQNIDPEYYQDVLDSGKHGQMIAEGWCADYPDPENFADVLFHSGADMNHSNYANPDLDKLLEAARVEPDTAKRLQMYSHAEKIIVNDAPAIFIDHSKSYVLVKPYLKGFDPLPMNIPAERYMSIDKSAFAAGQP